MQIMAHMQFNCPLPRNFLTVLIICLYLKVYFPNVLVLFDDGVVRGERDEADAVRVHHHALRLAARLGTGVVSGKQQYLRELTQDGFH